MVGIVAVLGSSPEAVVRYARGEGAGRRSAGSATAPLRGADSFAYVDLTRLRAQLEGRREWALAMPGWGGPDAARDPDQVLGPLGLFRQAYATARTRRDLPRSTTPWPGARGRAADAPARRRA
ncbi:MAG: hypothetical protein U0790_00925 [Isosphaeraceae bacterium]